MVPVTQDLLRPRKLIWLWTLVLLPPVAWLAAHNMLFSLTNEACLSGSRAAMAGVAVVFTLLCAAPALPAWSWWRQLSPAVESGERARLLLALAFGLSVIFTLVTLLTSVPILLLDSCRT